MGLTRWGPCIKPTEDCGENDKGPAPSAFLALTAPLAHPRVGGNGIISLVSPCLLQNRLRHGFFLGASVPGAAGRMHLSHSALDWHSSAKEASWSVYSLCIPSPRSCLNKCLLDEGTKENL